MQIPADISVKFRWMSYICAGLVVYIHMPLSGERTGAFSLFYEIFRNGVCQIAVPFFFAAAGHNCDVMVCCIASPMHARDSKGNFRR